MNYEQGDSILVDRVAICPREVDPAHADKCVFIRWQSSAFVQVLAEKRLKTLLKWRVIGKVPE